MYNNHISRDVCGESEFKATFRPGLCVRLCLDFLLQFISFSSFKRKRFHSIASSRAKKAKLVVDSSDDMVKNVETDCLSPRQVSKSHLV